MTGEAASLPGMIGEHPAMCEVYRLARLAARAELPVVIVGEAGSGKELVARALHELGAAQAGPFVDVNCAAIPEGLAEGHFFGWERGAFTGAVTQTVGLLEQAHGGTLFLDEACSLPLWLQAKLLRAIEGKDVRRLAARERRATTFRLVLAVAEDPATLVASKRWRADFAYRVAGVTIAVPALRERRSDIGRLARHFLRVADGALPKELGPEALHLLQRYEWPGNVRELKTLMERLAVFVEGAAIRSDHVRTHLPGLAVQLDERQRLESALALAGGNVSQAARALGVTRSTVYEWMKKHHVQRGSRLHLSESDSAGVRSDRLAAPRAAAARSLATS